MGKNIDHRLIQKFFEKECTVDEAREVLLWLKDDDNKEELEMLLKSHWEAQRNDRIETDFRKLYANILEEIANDKIKTRTRSFFSTGTYLGIAAAVSFFIISVFALIYILAPSHEDITQELVVKSTHEGERLTTKLPDGTVVVLHSESSISFPKNFEGNERPVSLKGEAYFTVAKNIHKPFIVKAGPVQTRALGTAFNIRADSALEIISVSLTEGRVVVNSPGIPGGEDFYMAPGEEIRYSSDGEFLEKTRFDYKGTIAWKDGILAFNNAGIEELKRKIERWYGITIIYTNQPDKNWKFTSEHKNERLENVLEGLKYSKNINYQIEGDSVLITFN